MSVLINTGQTGAIKAERIRKAQQEALLASVEKWAADKSPEFAAGYIAALPWYYTAPGRWAAIRRDFVQGREQHLRFEALVRKYPHLFPQ